MKRYIWSSFAALVVLLAAISCNQQTKEDNKTNEREMDSTDSQLVKPKESGYADVNGLKMYYEVYGEGKPLIMVHGSFMNIPMNWAEIIPILAKDRQVIVAEMQAHGRTKDIPRDFTYENMADDVSGLITQLRLDSVDVLGYSMGAGVAFQMGIRHADQVRRLVILSGVYKNDGWWPEVEKSFESMNADMFKGSPIQQQYDSLGNDPAKFPDFIDKVISVDRKKYDWSKEVKAIKAPIFMAIGDADGIRYEHALELFRAKGGGKMGDMNGLPKSRLAILPGTTHTGMISQKEMLIPMVTNFLDSDLNTAPPTF